MFRVFVEYYDREETEIYDYVTKEYWFEHLYQSLENDETVEHYTVEMVEEG